MTKTIRSILTLSLLASTLGACSDDAAQQNGTGLIEPDPVSVLAVNEPPASFAQCSACHSVAEGGPHAIGPNLFGIAGARVGAQGSYHYSEAMKASDLVWDRDTLDRYLANTTAVVPGTKMVIPPVADAAQRTAIIDYLETLK